MRTTKKTKDQILDKKISVLGVIVVILAMIVVLTLGGFFLWVMYGNDSDKGKDRSQTSSQQTQKQETAVLNVAADWSVPRAAFQGSNGSGVFVETKVQNSIDTQMLYENMGIYEDSKSDDDKDRIKAVKRFIKGLYYEADIDSGLSNGDTVVVTINSKEDVGEIESEAGIEIKGVGESKEVTVSGLVDKLSVNEMYGRQDLIQAAKEAAESAVRSSTEGNHKEIFQQESKYRVSLQYYGTYFAEPENDAAPDSLIVIYRMTSIYPDRNYSRWTKDGDYVYTYEMAHFEGVNKETTADDVKNGMKYDTYMYDDQAYDVLQWYKENTNADTGYTIQKIG